MKRTSSFASSSALEMLYEKHEAHLEKALLCLKPLLQQNIHVQNSPTKQTSFTQSMGIRSEAV